MIGRLGGIGLLILAMSSLVPLPGGAQTDAIRLQRLKNLRKMVVLMRHGLLY